MEYLLELYDAEGTCLDFFRFNTPMDAMAVLAELTKEEGGYRFVNATCYHKDKPQWELEIK